MADQWVEAYWRLPSVSRTMATAAFLTSVGVYTSLIPGYWIVFHPQFLWRFPPQIWRFFTAFLLTGPELSMLFDTYFVYSYLSQLEAGNPRFSRKEDLLWYLTFCGGTIMMMNYVSGLGFTTFLQALNLAMCYTVTQDQRGMKANLMFVTIPAPMTPFAMLAFNLLFPNGVRSMLLQLLGLLSAHLFDFLTRIWPEYGGGRNLISTPAFFSTAVRSLESRAATSAAAPSGGSRGPLPDSWRTRGPGQRLG